MGVYTFNDYRKDMMNENYSEIFKYIKDGLLIDGEIVYDFAQTFYDVVDSGYASYTPHDRYIDRYYVVNVNGDYYRCWIKESIDNEGLDDCYDQIFEKVHKAIRTEKVWVS